MTLPESGSKRKLLDVAEQLFAEKGFGAVSIRDITGLAKCNVAAVNYHFGGREKLMGLVMQRHMTPVTEERLVRLDSLERKWAGKVVPLEEIIDALVRPLVSQVKKSGLSEQLFYRLMGRIFAQQGDGLPAVIEAQLQKTNDRYIRLFAKSLPTLATEDLVWRVHFITGGMIRLLTHHDLPQRLTNGAAGTPTMEATLGRFIRFAAAGLREGIEAADPLKKGPQAMFDF